MKYKEHKYLSEIGVRGETRDSIYYYFNQNSISSPYFKSVERYISKFKLILHHPREKDSDNLLFVIGKKSKVPFYIFNVPDKLPPKNAMELIIKLNVEGFFEKTYDCHDWLKYKTRRDED